jgi:hypothetical protein
MKEHRSPELSVVLVTPDDFETIAATVRHLRAQTVRDRLELVLVAPSAGGIGLPRPELNGFLQTRVVAIGTVRSWAHAMAAGIREAAAPVVALGEDHSFPEPGWAEALIAAHGGDWAAVGPVVGNANPGSMVSWADLLIGYGPWLEPAGGRAVEFLPGHNSSYKRAVLLEYGEALEEMLESETILHWDLRARGCGLYLEPAAKTNHMNFSVGTTWAVVQVYAGRMFAASRARNWPPLRRLAYAGAAPLIPLVRLWRILRRLSGAARPRAPFPHVFPALILGLALDGAGQALGYLFGAGKTAQPLAHFEFHRERYVRKQDRLRE